MIKKEMLISEILEKIPQAPLIMESFGLHCAGCPSKAAESLENGAKAHDLSDEDLNKIIDALNTAQEKDFLISDDAVAKIKEVAKANNKEGQGLRLELEDHSYVIRFDDPKDDDCIFEHDGVKVLISNKDLDHFKGGALAFEEGAGFRIFSPNQGCGCGH